MLLTKGVFGIKSGKEIERRLLKKGKGNNKSYCSCNVNVLQEL